MTYAETIALRRKIEHAAEQQTDADALNSIELFPKWVADIDVTAGDRRQFKREEWDKAKLYKCVQEHHTSAEWTPDITPALWIEVSIEEWPEIPEVIPSTNPYMTGDKGTWKGEHYICQMDNCVWNPDQYPDAWEKQE